MDLFRKISSNNWPPLSIEEIKRRARLLIVDDQDFLYLPLFIKDGYQMEKWDDVLDLPKLESGYFDIILLDLKGVGRVQSESEQGFGILRHLKNVNPIQIIVAYSNSDWPIKYQEFFNMADVTLPKDKDYVDFKLVVDRLLADRFSLGFYVERISRVASIGGYDDKKIATLAEEAILKKSKNKFEKYLTEHIQDGSLIQTILQITSFAISLTNSI